MNYKRVLRANLNIPWKLKSFIFNIIDYLNAPAILYFLQRHITKSSKIKNVEISQDWIMHRNAIEIYNKKKFIFEFGAGKNLAQNLYLSNYVDYQLVVDLFPMLEIKTLNRVRLLLSKKIKLRSNIEIKNINDLANYGIEYRAPFDASKSGLKNCSVDACISTNTLEHIPKNDLINIFKELNRILKDDGIISAKIDYSDHYAHTDSNISLLNFLKYSDNEWKKYNHNCHYQNRLRHGDYTKIFNDCGFMILSEKIKFDEKTTPEVIRKKFLKNNKDWKATSAHLILKKYN